MKLSFALPLTFLVLSAMPASAASCESLMAIHLPHTTITLAQPVPAGAFTIPGAPENTSAKDLPAFCRVAATLKPTSESDIKIEVWLPLSSWNGKFLAVGNGGWAGSISYRELMDSLRRGYATSSTDTGHSGADGKFTSNWEKYVDFSYRSEHEMAVQAKEIIKAFYGSAPRLSYWNGCSTGGRQGLMEAQRFPDDFDGIIAGSSANPKSYLNAWNLTMAQAVKQNPASFIPPSKYPMIHQAVIAACDATDGLNDGLIADPTQCRFDPIMIVCKGEDNASCLTSPQVEIAKKVFLPATVRGKEVFPGHVPGPELGWNRFIGNQAPEVSIDQFRYVLHRDETWDWQTFDLEKDLALSAKIEKGVVNAIDPNIKPFVERGGKMIMYHGWNDANVTAKASINYYKDVERVMGGPAKTSSVLRLFLAPGMEHCGSGEGPNTFDMVTPLEKWVEEGKAPDQIVASHSTSGKVDRTRPLCVYPQVAQYKGTGSIDDAANFVCK
jgi:feruloyl esterase